MSSNSLIITVCCFLMAACAPQAELVRTRTEMTDVREDTKATKARVLELQKRLDQDIQKRLDGLEANVKGTVDVQKVMADYGAKSDQLATDIQLLSGKLEENNFRIAELAQKLDDKSFKIAELSARIDELEAKIKLVGAGTTTASTGQSGTAREGDKKSVPKTIEPSEAYRQAKSDYDKGSFDLALAGFQNYIARFPDTSQAAGAQYWIGECFSAKKEYSKAVAAFEKVVKSYPKSEKVPGAKLKIGLTYLNEKNIAKAKEQLNKVIKEHPGTNEAEIAKDRLHKIGP
jgi:tol-pal system protein YbgF